MKDVLKKFGVLIIVGALFIAMIVYFSIDRTKISVKGKKSDGKDVVYTIGDQNVVADDFYDLLNDSLGEKVIFREIELATVDQVVETTDELTAQAKTIVDNYTQQFEQQYGDQAEEQITTILKSVGYETIDDFDDFIIANLKVNELIKTYIDDNQATTFDSYSQAKSPRIVSHILVSIADFDNITEEEQAKMDEITAKLAEGTDFKDVAKEYSDDTNSAVLNGSLGLIDADSQLVPEFLEASLNLQEGEQTDWIKTDYGYHLIKCDATNYAALKEDETLYSNIATYIPTLRSKAIYEQAVKLGLDFHGDTELEQAIKTYVGITDQEER